MARNLLPSGTWYNADVCGLGLLLATVDFCWQPWTFCWQPCTFLPGGLFKRKRSLTGNRGLFCKADFLNADFQGRGCIAMGNRGIDLATHSEHKAWPAQSPFFQFHDRSSTFNRKMKVERDSKNW